MYAPQLFQGTSGEVTVPASSTVRDSIARRDAALRGTRAGRRGWA